MYMEHGHDWAIPAKLPKMGIRPTCMAQEKDGRLNHNSMKATAKWKHRNVSVVRDFPLVPGKYNRYLSARRKREIHEHMSRVIDECTKIEQEEVQLLKAGALLGTDFPFFFSFVFSFSHFFYLSPNLLPYLHCKSITFGLPIFYILDIPPLYLRVMLFSSIQRDDETLKISYCKRKKEN